MVQTIIALSRVAVTSIRVISIDIVVALTSFAQTHRLQRIAIVHGIAFIASLARVAFATIALERARRVV